MYAKYVNLENKSEVTYSELSSNTICITVKRNKGIILNLCQLYNSHEDHPTTTLIHCKKMETQYFQAHLGI